MSVAEFKISYDGSALDSHLMDVRDLAPALLSIGQLLEASNKIVNKNTSPIQLKVKGLLAGSFEVQLFVEEFKNIFIDTFSFFKSENANSIANLLAILGFIGIPSVYSLISLFKKIKGRKLDKVEKINNSTVHITIENEVIVVPISLIELYSNIEVRKSIEKIVEPLSKEGIDKFTVYKSDNSEVFSINKEEVNYFKYPETTTEIVNQYEVTGAYSIISLSFKDDNKWRLNDGSGTINVTITDTYFKKRVDSNEVSFSKGDILMCRMLVTQINTEDGLKNEYELKEVIEHKIGSRQLKLF